MAPRRCLPALVALAVVAPALTSCQLLTGGSSLDDALEVVPGSTTRLTFLDRAAAAERLGLDDVGSGASSEEVADYAEAFRDDPVSGTPLARYAAPMQQAVFSELDVVWWAQATEDDAPPIDVYRVDDVDLDALADDLEDAGLAREEEDGRTLLSGDPTEVVDESGLLDGRYPVELALGTLLDPDEDLVVVGGELDRVVDVLEDDVDSLTDRGTFEELVDGVDDVELAHVAGEPSCGGERTTPEQSARSGVGDLGTPEAVGYFVTGEDAATSGRLLFADDDAAEADLEARRRHLEAGASLRTGQPVADLGTAALDRDGSLVTMELDLEHPPNGLRAATDADAFFACAP